MEEEKAIEQPIKAKRGQSREHMAAIAKKGGEVTKMKGAIKAYEKAQKRKEIDEKFAMIQAEIAKTSLATSQKLTNEPESDQSHIPERESAQPTPVESTSMKKTPKPGLATSRKLTKEPPEPESAPPALRKKTPKPPKIVEIIEEEEASDEEEEEVIVKRIIKKKPSQPRIDNNDKFIQKSNIEMLKNKFNDDVRKRLMSSLFD